MLTPLAAKNIDTGMGLERLACVMQGKRTNYEIDTLAKLGNSVKSILKLKTPVPDDKIRSVYAIVDHARAVVFSIHDGAIPSNEGRGYVIRKLIRRAVWHGRQLGARQAFLYELVNPVIEVMKKPYPELKNAEKNLVLTIRSEEERFLETIEQGTQILEKMIAQTKHRKSNILSGEDIFKLYDTYGFPDELTEMIVLKHGLHVDLEGFEKLMDEQRERSKKGSDISSEIFAVSDFAKKLADIPKTKFLGYETLSTKGKVLFAEHAGDKYLVILDQSPFYGEGGGQVGDRGIFENAKFKGVVIDTQKEEDRILHYVRIEKGILSEGDTVHAEVNREIRDATRRNHTATHILQAVLRKQLGSHVRQLGSLVNEDKLRFDFSHPKALTQQEIKHAENAVNEIIRSKIQVCPEEKSIEDARKEGALAFFGDKYGDRVRLLRIGDTSLEFCGGTHCSNVGDIQAFMITKETSVGAGVRRIEAITGTDTIQNFVKQLEQSSQEQAEKLQAKKKESEARKVTKLSDAQIASMKIEWKGLFLIPRICNDYTRTINELRNEADHIINVMKEKTIAVVVTSDDKKVSIIVALTKDLENREDLSAKDMVSKIAAQFEGTGGGNKLFAQGGGKNPEKIESIININKLPQILG
ncbi:MAG: alanine--tRNA ligase [Candidatus Omnitrophica bacterium]|nr:alanine--tRNA ligase [Candidatus Omnitrophota bacterium]